MASDQQLTRTNLLKADCAQCVGLCCVALAFAKSADFAFDKDAGDPCVNLEDDNRCGIHPQLRERGFKGCTVFDCFGAGQRVTQQTLHGASWRDSPESREAMFAVFPIVRQLHEMLWYLDDAAGRRPPRALRNEIETVYAAIDELARRTPEAIATTDVEAQRHRVNDVLARVSDLVRADARDGAATLPRRIRSGADLIGASLAGFDLRGADLRGTLLIAADLHDADLRGADVIGADLRDANLAGADVSSTLYLTQFQVNAANGDAATQLPSGLDRPSHWAD